MGLGGELFSYACTAFPDHLACADPKDPDLRALLLQFLQGNVFTWIESVVRWGQLDALTRLAKNSEGYLERSKAAQGSLDDDAAIRGWAIDLVHVPTKFGDVLRNTPEAIHWVIQPFLPTGSTIYKSYGWKRPFSITGFSYRHWDDRLVSLNFPKDRATTAVCHGDSLFAIALDTGSILLYQTAACQEYMVLEHTEPVQHLMAQLIDWPLLVKRLCTCGMLTLGTRSPSSTWSSLFCAFLLTATFSSALQS